jgi:hypothetical protein
MRQVWDFSKVDFGRTCSDLHSLEMLQEIRDLLEGISSKLSLLPTCGQLRQHLNETAKKIRAPKRRTK